MIAEAFVGLIIAIIVILSALFNAFIGVDSADGVVTGGAATSGDASSGAILNAEEMKEAALPAVFERKITKNTRKIPYRKGMGKFRPVLHRGQRKLLLSEIEFLTLHGDKSDIVVYAGSAPGSHLRYLLRLFPKHHFELWDPRDFWIKEGPRVKIHQEIFTNDAAKLYHGKNVLFVSDIRTGSSDNPEWDEEIIENMDMQSEWIEHMKPIMSMLKFRLTWEKKKQKYLDGDVYFQVWAPRSSSEARLMTDGKRTKIYDARDYEDKLYRFGLITRAQSYDVPKDVLKKVPGADLCYDCAAEVHILREYCIKYGHNVADIPDMMNAITKELGRGLDAPPHGKCGFKNSVEKKYQCAKAIAQ